MHRFMLMCVCVLAAAVTSTVAAQQSNEESFLPEDRQVITPETVPDLKPIGQLGPGLLYDGMFLDDGTLAVITSRGLYLYPEGDLNDKPELIEYDPNPFAERYPTRQRAQISRDGDVITVSNSFGTVQVNLVTDGSQLVDAATSPEQDTITSPDGSLQAINNPMDAIITLVDTATDETLAQLELGERVLTDSIFFSPMGDQLVIAGQDETQIYDTTTAEQVATVQGTVLAVTADAYVLLAEQEEGSAIDVVLQDVASGDVNTRIPNVLCGTDSARVMYSAQAETLYLLNSSVASGTLRAWDISREEPQLAGEVPNFRTFSTEFAFSPDGNSLYVAYNSLFPGCSGEIVGEGVVRYDMTTGRAVERLNFSPEFSPVSVATNANGDVLAGGLSALALQRNTVFSTYTADGWGFVNSVALADDGTQYAHRERNIVQLDGPDVIRIFAEDVGGGNAFTSGWGNAVRVYGDLFFYISDANTVTIHDRASDTTLDTLTFERQVNSVEYDPDGQILAVHTGFGRVEEMLNEVFLFRVGETVEGLAVAEVNTAMHAMDLSPGGALLAVTHTGGDIAAGSLDIGESFVHFYDTSTGQRVGGLSEEIVQLPIAFSPDGTYLIVTGGGGNLLLYGVPNG